MRGTKLISVRIDEDFLAKIDAYCDRSDYRKRSDVINAAVRLLATAGDDKFIAKVCTYWPQYGDVIDKLELEYHREHK